MIVLNISLLWSYLYMKLFICGNILLECINIEGFIGIPYKVLNNIDMEKCELSKTSVSILEEVNKKLKVLGS